MHECALVAARTSAETVVEETVVGLARFALVVVVVVELFVGVGRHHFGHFVAVRLGKLVSGSCAIYCPLAPVHQVAIGGHGHFIHS